MIENIFRSKSLYRLHVLGQYISQINGCSSARMHNYYWTVREENNQMRKEFIDDCNKVIKNKKMITNETKHNLYKIC